MIPLRAYRLAPEAGHCGVPTRLPGALLAVPLLSRPPDGPTDRPAQSFADSCGRCRLCSTTHTAIWVRDE